jgi:hypothetical protein
MGILNMLGDTPNFTYPTFPDFIYTVLWHKEGVVSKIILRKNLDNRKGQVFLVKIFSFGCIVASADFHGSGFC